jgi:hypothetical protein
MEVNPTNAIDWHFFVLIKTPANVVGQLPIRGQSAVSVLPECQQMDQGNLWNSLVMAL